MAKTKAQKQEDYIECLKAKDLLTLSKQTRKKKKLEQLKNNQAAYNLHLQKNRFRKAVQKVIFPLVDRFRGLCCTAFHFFIFFNSFEIIIATMYYLKSG